jgi:hypothetical protein
VIEKRRKEEDEEEDVTGIYYASLWREILVVVLMRVSV